MEKDLRKKLGIDDWLELVKEDRNCNGAYISFGQYMYLLEKDNQELKKQLEEIDSKLFFTKNELEMRQKSIDNKLRQQKEFIEWLERRLFLLRDVASELALGMCSTDYQDAKIEVYQEILSKYKEIIGGSNDKTNKKLGRIKQSSSKR